MLSFASFPCPFSFVYYLYNVGKFGASSPERERKLMSLAESGPQTRKTAKVSKSSYSLSVANTQSPGPSPVVLRKDGALTSAKSHERSHSDTPPIPVGKSELTSEKVPGVTSRCCRSDRGEQQRGEPAGAAARQRVQPGEPGPAPPRPPAARAPAPRRGRPAPAPRLPDGGAGAGGADPEQGHGSSALQ